MFGRKKRREAATAAQQEDLAAAQSNEQPEGIRALGPWDDSEFTDSREDYLDLGAILLKPFVGLNVRMELDEQTRAPRALNLDFQDGSVQVQAFAAPKSMGLWDEVRRELVEGLQADGGATTISDGPLGRQVDVRFPAVTEDGQQGYRLARFVGIDGPRWFLRAVYTGGGAMPSTTMEALDDVVRSLIIVRGRDPRPPRDLLPLQIPEQPQETQSREAESAGHGGHNHSPGGQAPRRGPEIAEIG